MWQFSCCFLSTHCHIERRKLLCNVCAKCDGGACERERPYRDGDRHRQTQWEICENLCWLWYFHNDSTWSVTMTSVVLQCWYIYSAESLAVKGSLCAWRKWASLSKQYFQNHAIYDMQYDYVLRLISLCIIIFYLLQTNA